MTTFDVYIDDDRYSVLQLLFLAAADEASAIDAARAMLRESRHHRGVELRLAERTVYAAGSLARAAGVAARATYGRLAG